MQHEDPYRFVDALVGSDPSSDPHESDEDDDDEPPSSKQQPPFDYPSSSDVADNMHASDDDDDDEYVPYSQDGYQGGGQDSIYVGGHHQRGYEHNNGNGGYDTMFDESASAGGDHSSYEEHPFLDMDEQRQCVASDRLENHMRWCDSMSERQRLSLDNRRCALKILINEACLRDRMNTKKEALKVALYYQLQGQKGSLRHVIEDHEREDGQVFATRYEVATLRSLNRQEGIGRLYDSVVRCPSPVLMDRYTREILDPDTRSLVQEKDSRILQLWRYVSEQVVDDMECFDYSATVLKNLSCMSVFIPENISRDYGENFVARQERLKKMRSLVDDLAMEGQLFVDDNDDIAVPSFDEDDDKGQGGGEDEEEGCCDDVDEIMIGSGERNSGGAAAGVEEGLADSLSGGDDDPRHAAAVSTSHEYPHHQEGSLDEDELLGANGNNNCGEEGSQQDSSPTDQSDDFFLISEKEESVRLAVEVPLGDEFAFL